ncbi:hypothetical protein B0H10DRAFT_1953176 [Mycena sp. CBHHK59/15]|nr:hypothetical protein B0H10DRAFT_1953176 [Mycena sp. CBHHK59/15]
MCKSSLVLTCMSRAGVLHVVLLKNVYLADARTPSFTAAADAPLVHPHRRTTSYSHAYAQPNDAVYGSGVHGRAGARQRTRKRPHAPAPAPALPTALRRTLAGAGWVGAEHGEREGLVRAHTYSTSAREGGPERGGGGVGCFMIEDGWWYDALYEKEVILNFESR